MSWLSEAVDWSLEVVLKFSRAVNWTLGSVDWSLRDAIKALGVVDWLSEVMDKSSAASMVDGFLSPSAGSF